VACPKLFKCCSRLFSGNHTTLVVTWMMFEQHHSCMEHHDPAFMQRLKEATTIERILKQRLSNLQMAKH